MSQLCHVLTAASIGLGLMVVDVSVPAWAQTGARSSAGASYRAETDPQYNGLLPNGCIKWYYQDRTPCDPDYFKQADGRCAQNR